MLNQVDCVVILTDHSSIDYESIAAAASLVVDARNAIKSRHPHVVRLGAPMPEAAGATTGRSSGVEAA